MGIFDDILDGLGWIWDNTVGAAAGAIWDTVVGGLVSWVVDAIAWFVQAVLRFFERSSTPSLTSDWFSGDGKIGPDAQSPYGVIAWLALSLLLLCVLVGVIQGLLSGEGPALAGRVARDVPLAILGIVVTVAVAQVLLRATDELAHVILENTQAGQNAKALLKTLSEPDSFADQSTFVVFILGLFGVIGAFLLWIELLIRASLLYLLIALSPLAYAAFVWPATRRVLRRLAELVVALVLSKVVIAIALAVAASALTRGPSARGIPDPGEQKVGTMLVGVIMFLLATLAPFLILKLLPVVETAVAAQGISRGPWRATQSAAMTSFYLGRLAGTGPGAPRAASNGRTPTGVAAMAGSGDAGASAGSGRPARQPAPSESETAGRSHGAGRGGAAPGRRPEPLDLAGTDTPPDDPNGRR